MFVKPGMRPDDPDRQFMWRQSYGTNPSHRLHTVFQMGLTDGVDQ